MNKSKVMVFSIIIMVILTAVFIVLSIVQFINTSLNFNAWFMVILLAIFCVIQVFCIVIQKFSIKKLGFYLLHIGLVAFLLGNFMYFLIGDTFYSFLPVDSVTYAGVPVVDIEKTNAQGQLVYTGEEVKLGFNIGATYLDYEYYPKQNPDNPMEASVLKRIDAKIVVNSKEKNFTINNTVHAGKYKLYFNTFSDGDDPLIILLYKYDPGEYISTTGLIMIIAGSFIMSFYKPKKDGDDDGKKKPIKSNKKAGGSR